MANRRRGSVKPAKTVVDPVTGKRKPAGGTTWFFQVDVGEGSSRKQVKRRGFPTKAAAQETLTELLQGVRQQEHVDFRRQTLGDWLREEWLPRIRQEEIAISTWSRYAIDCRLHVLPHPIADVQLQKLDGEHLDAHWALLRAKQSQKSMRTLSPRTVNLVSTTIGRAMRDAVLWGHRVGNPCARSKMPTGGRQAERPSWDAETLASFLRWARSHRPTSRSDQTKTTGEPDRLCALWHLTATTGMRRGEVVALAWSDLHVDGQCTCRPRPTVAHLVISTAIREIGGEDIRGLSDVDASDLARGWMWAPPKTEAGFRTISLDRGTVEVLQEWRTRQAAERLALGTGWRGEEGHDGAARALVFAHVDGSAIMPSEASEIFRRRSVRFGRPLSIHGLRHTWATLALEAGVHPKVVQKRLGHTRIQTTLDLYSHVRPQVDAEAAQTVADLLATAPISAPDPAPRGRRPRVTSIRNAG